jgi:Ca-activated chloride channel family protein
MQTPTSLLFAAAFTTALAAQGGFVPDRNRPQQPGSVQVGLLQVRATIVDGAGTTEIIEDLLNPTGTPQEAVFLLPLPDKAVADRFTMTVNGVETAAEVLDSNRARTVYEAIVRQRRDPGLLEYAGQGLLRARIFPVPPGNKVQVRVRYSEVLAESGGITSWHFPVRALWGDGLGPDRVSLLFEVQSTASIKNVFSPLPGLDIARDGDHRVKASLELGRGQMPVRDFAVHYGIGDQDFGIHLLTQSTTGDGYFLMLLSPKREWPKQAGVGRAINLVLDTSGSMQGEKMEQARAAVRSFLHSLTTDDWFNVIPFSTDARPFFSEPVPASADKVKEALAKVEELQARGGTNIEEALAIALRTALPDCSKRSGHPGALVPITVFLTDGQPTVGQTGIDALLAQAKTQNQEHARIFVFGVGHDVNTRLLDTLAAATRGDRDYVAPAENIEVKTDALFRKLSGPVMTDVQVSADGIDLLDIEPRALPDLFQAGTLTIVGRYRGAGQKAIRLRGNIAGKPQEYVFEATFAASNRRNDWLPSLWAQRRIAALLDAIRMSGQQKELVDEVTRISKEHGIVTPFTSHLILEEGQHVAQFRGGAVGGGAMPAGDFERLRRDWVRTGSDDFYLGATPLGPSTAGPAGQATGGRGVVLDAPSLDKAAAAEAKKARGEQLKDESGANAVGISQKIGRLRDGDGGGDDSAIGLTHRRVAGRSFYLVDGVWVDGAFTAEMKAKVKKIAAFSDDYFALLAQHGELGPVFALSTRLVLVVDGAAIEIE